MGPVLTMRARRNACLVTVIAELERAGAEFTVTQSKKHIKISWCLGDNRRVTIVPLSPSDSQRGPMNSRAVVRRQLRRRAT
jgi:hypothetical protein